MEHLIQAIDCLTPSEVEKVLDILSSKEWHPTTVFGGRPQGKDVSECIIDKSIRSNTRYCPSDDSEEAIIMHEGMNAALLRYRDELFNVSPHYSGYPIPGTYRTNCYREQIQVLKYEHEEYYNWHTDQATDKNVNEINRTISIVLYLECADEGGRTIFPSRAYKPKPGQALIFPSNWCYPHSAEPVRKGRKIAAVTWYHSNYNYD